MKDTKVQVKAIVESSIRNFFTNKKVEVNHVLDHLFPQERRIRSLVGGLETSMGTKVWEPLAKFFAQSNDFTVKNHTEYNASVPVPPKFCRDLISSFKHRKITNSMLRNEEFFKEVKAEIQKRNYVVTERSKPSAQGKGLGLDVWLEKNGIEYLVDIKTNQINTGGGSTFTENQLIWYCWRALDGAENVKCLLAFPFNPHTGKDFWAKESSKAHPLIPKVEAVVGNEFWDFLSGSERTVDLIFECYKELGETGFANQFKDIFKLPNK